MTRSVSNARGAFISQEKTENTFIEAMRAK